MPNAASIALAESWKDLRNGDLGATDKIIPKDFVAHAALLTGTGPARCPRGAARNQPAEIVKAGRGTSQEPGVKNHRGLAGDDRAAQDVPAAVGRHSCTRRPRRRYLRCRGGRRQSRGAFEGSVASASPRWGAAFFRFRASRRAWRSASSACPAAHH